MQSSLFAPAKPKPKTLGAQMLDMRIKHAGEKTQTIRETTDEMGKKYMEDIVKLAESELQKHSKDFYILEVLEHDPILEGVIKLRLQARWTRPAPEWGIALYKVHAVSGQMTYEWGLPQKHEAYIMIQNPEGWEQKTMQDIMAFVDGKLE